MNRHLFFAIVAIPISIGCASPAINPQVASEPFGDVAGVVHDSSSGDPVGEASIRVEGIDAIRTRPTDTLGKFRLTHVPSGKQVLILRRIGYKSKRVSVAIAAGRERAISVLLSRLDACDIGCDESSIVTVIPTVAAFRSDSITKGDNGERLAALVGTIVDSVTGRPLPGAFVLVQAQNLQEKTFGQYADLHGGFVIGRIKPGPHQVFARRDGFLTVTRRWDAGAGKIDKVQFVLPRDTRPEPQPASH